MTGYEPLSITSLALCGVISAATLLLGFLLTRLRSGVARELSWLLAVTGVCATHFVMLDEPAGLRMLALCSNLLFGMKAIVSAHAVASGDARLAAAKWFLWALGWAGMRPSVFAKRSAPNTLAARGYALWGLVHATLGAAAIAGARTLWVQTGERIAPTILLMVGLSLCLHFALFNLVAAFWQSIGFDTRSLFRNPAASRSLSEFWSKRWNLAFSEMMAGTAFRPVSRRLGVGAGAFAGFLLSGVLHEVAISLPVNAGWGLPLAYFALHGVLVLIERRMPILTRQVLLGRLWTLLWVLAPTPILFHPAFLRGVIWPIIGMG